MGRTNCPIHGYQGFYEMCEHIWEGFETGLLPEIKKLPIFGTKFCTSCYLKHNVESLGDITLEDFLTLPETEQTKFEEKFDVIYNGINRKGKCIECFNKLRLIDARKRGKALPFEPYENTLMYQDNETIEVLKTILLANYTFQSLKHPYLNNFDAFHIIGGGITYPFSIKFYYVIHPKDQHLLLQLIDDFFEQIPKKQRKISFYEAENWITKKNGGGYRGEEVLLLERVIR